MARSMVPEEEGRRAAARSSSGASPTRVSLGFGPWAKLFYFVIWPLFLGFFSCNVWALSFVLHINIILLEKKKNQYEETLVVVRDHCRLVVDEGIPIMQPKLKRYIGGIFGLLMRCSFF